MPWQPLPDDVPLDHEQVQPKDAPADTQAEAPQQFQPLPDDAQLDQAAPKDQPGGFTDEQKQAILDYMPKAKDAADLEQFASALSGGKTKIANAKIVLNEFRKGNHTFGWLNSIQATPEKPREHDWRDSVGDSMVSTLDTLAPGAGQLLQKARNDGSGKAFVEHAANAMAFDYGPEVAGLMDTVASPSEWADFKASLDRHVATEHATLQGDSADHPVASAAGELTGAGLTAPLTGAVGEAANLGRVGKAAQMVTEGAAYGSGAAGPGNRVEGGAIGAVAAPLIAGAGKAAFGLVDTGKTVLSGSPGLARRIIAKAIAADENTPASVGADIAAAHANGVPMALGDTGENVRGLLAASSRASGTGRTIVRDALEQRQAELADRVTQHIDRDLGEVANPHEVADKLMTQARTEAGPLYEKAYAQRVPDGFVEKLKPLLQRPSVQKALGNARRIAQEEGEDPDGLGLTVNSEGQTVIGAAPSWKTLDYIKRGMDDVVEGYRDKTSGKLVLDTEGRAVNNTLRSYIGALDKTNPTYAAARAAYAGPVKGISAMNAGRKALNMTADDLEARMRDMSPFEKTMFAAGTRRAMAELVQSKGDTADIVNALVGTGKKRAMLGRLFGDRQQFQRFVDTLGQEKEGWRSMKQALLGSPTAANVSDDAALQTATMAADFMTTGLPVATSMRYAFKFGVGKLGEKAKQQVAALLSNTDPAAISELAAELRAQAEKRGLNVRKVNALTRAGGNAAVALQPMHQAQ